MTKAFKNGFDAAAMFETLKSEAAPESATSIDLYADINGANLKGSGHHGDIFHNALPQGSTLVSAQPKVGKSWLSLNAAWSVAAGFPLFGKFKSSGAGDVLILALEDTPGNTKMRLDTMGVPEEARKRMTFRFPADDGSVPTLDGSLQAVVEAWVVKVSNPKLVVIDVLTDVRSPKKNRELVAHDRDDMRIINMLGAKHGLAMMVITHDRKEGGTNISRVSGSFGITGSAFAIWNVSRATGGGISLSMTGRSIPEDELLLKEHKTGSHVFVAQGEEARLSEQETRILNAAVELDQSSNQITPKLLEEQLGYIIPAASIRKACSRLFDKQHLNRTKTKGLYELNHLSDTAQEAINEFRRENGLPIIKLQPQ